MAASGAGSKVAVYLGDGCYWHTQYDMYMTERAAPFSRGAAQITSRVGYAGSTKTGPGGQVCYHGGPAGTNYGVMGYAEAAQVMLDYGKRKVQFTALVKRMFSSYKKVGGKWLRLDPQDYGPDYRNVIGLPGGVNGELYSIIVANNKHSLKLIEGKGAKSDKLDEGVVYIYDTAKFPFYRGERYHQFHANVVLGRACPPAYLTTTRALQIKLGNIDPNCGEKGSSGKSNVILPPPPAPPPAPVKKVAAVAVGLKGHGGTVQYSAILAPDSLMKKRAHGTCTGAAMKPLRWNNSWKTADQICCYNRHYAEYFGQWLTTNFPKTQPAKLPITFYDSVTRKPLFVAPIGRTWAAFYAESTKHGWPSFRDEEVVAANVRVLPDGETVSADGTHLGHNLPDCGVRGGVRCPNRYCINLVSVAGNKK